MTAPRILSIKCMTTTLLCMINIKRYYNLSCTRSSHHEQINFNDMFRGLHYEKYDLNF